MRSSVDPPQSLLEDETCVDSCRRVFQPTKNSFVDTLRSVLEDVKWSLLFLVLTIWGFAGAFYILFREDQDKFTVSNIPFSEITSPVIKSRSGVW